MNYEQKAPTSCNGCNHNWYSARHGQARNTAPHSRCSSLNRDIPMVVTREDKWVASEIPKDCPHQPQPLAVQ